MNVNLKKKDYNDFKKIVKNDFLVNIFYRHQIYILKLI